jgi:hypothetical protein
MTTRLCMTPDARAEHWTAGYIGHPWAPGYTCWALVRDAQAEHYGRALPDLALQPGDDAIRAAVQGWHRVAEPADGDVLTMVNHKGLLHVGVMTDAGVLHLPGGIDEQGNAYGACQLDTLERLALQGYGHIKAWRAAA